MKTLKRLLALLLACALLAGCAVFARAEEPPVPAEETQVIIDFSFGQDADGKTCYRVVFAPEFVTVKKAWFFPYAGNSYIRQNWYTLTEEDVPDAGTCIVMYIYDLPGNAEELIIHPGGLVRADGSENDEIRYPCALKDIEQPVTTCRIEKIKASRMVEETYVLDEWRDGVEGEVYRCTFPAGMPGDVYYGDLNDPPLVAQGVESYDVRLTGSGRQTICCKYGDGRVAETCLTVYTLKGARDECRRTYLSMLAESLPLLPVGLLFILFPLTILPGAAILGGPLEGISGLIHLGALYRADCDNLR